MIKILEKNQLKIMEDYPTEVISAINKIITILDENYGYNRSVEIDLGGYVIVLENISDIKVLKKNKLKGLIPEYTDEIICSEAVNYTSSLFLLSSDFSVVVIADEELSKILLE